MMRDGLNSLGEVHGGDLNLVSGITPDKANDVQDNSFFNLNNPTEKDRFHWNWSYEANSTKNPQYKYTFPGGQAWMRLHKPKVRAWLGFSMNLTSHMPDITQPPHEKVDIAIQSFADLDLDIGTAADFDKDSSSSVLHNMLDVFPIPILSKLKTDTEMFMRPFTFHIGSTPITVTPGWSINMKIFHIGKLKGTMRVGLATKLLTRGVMHFDTTFGEQHHFEVEMKNVNFTSPAWMLFTKHFQLGVEFEPNVWMKGAFGILHDVEFGFGLRPYFNMSIMEEDKGDGSDTEELAIYPYLLVGLPPGHCYALKISANGQYKTTACQLSLGGVIRFQNKLEIFEFGLTSEKKLLTDPIQVDILKNGEEIVATGEVVCLKVENGRCHPHPTKVHMEVEGEEVVAHLGIYFQENALAQLEINMQSMTVRVTLWTVSSQAEEFQELVSNEQAEGNLQLCFCHDGREDCFRLDPKFPGANTLFTSNTIWEAGPVFTELWVTKPASSSFSHDPSQNDERLQNKVFIRGASGKLLCKGVLLQTQVEEEKPIKSIEDLESKRKDAMQTIPTQVMLVDAANPSKEVGSAQIELDMMPAQYGAMWIQPFEGDRFVVGLSYTFAWSTHGAVEGDSYAFTIALHEVSGEQCAGLGKQLSTEDFKVKCSKDPRVKVHRFGGSHLPCVFERQVVCPQEAAGKTVIALAKWYDAAYYMHRMASNAFRCEANTGRRLNATVAKAAAQVARNDESVGFGFESQGHKEGLSPEARAAFEDLAKHCHERPLKYSIGAGVNYIQLVKNMPYAGGGGVGSSSDASNPMGGHFMPDGSYISNPYPIWSLGQDEENRKRLSDLLPESVCIGGMCEGMMLGCQKRNVRPINIPKVCYKFNRTFNWIPHVGPSARHVIAYGLMILPSAVKEAGIEAQQIEKALQTNQSQPLQALTEDLGKIFQPEQARRLLQEAFPTPAGGEFKEETLDDMEDDWSKHGSYDEMIVEITEPMHYPITDAVMQYLLSADAFRGLEDGREATHGPIKIIGYELLDSAGVAAKRAKRRRRAESDLHHKARMIPLGKDQPLQTVQSVAEASSELWSSSRGREPPGLVQSQTGPGSFGLFAAGAALLLLIAVARRRQGYSALTSQPEAEICA
ncbi:unnamed protein product [Symbiodinium pilosum]|uniref:Uncharacterized protein n=1 Tax=Symbiodinium pilosum TaxID=2952 RepID=A0A812KVV6_SYMPI|nr:unnamed protein product [Symbiodinium pilosum]